MSNHKNITQFGIDGCKSGWLAIWMDENNYRFDVCTSLIELYKKYPSATRYLIDIPVGLGSKAHPRTLEKEMRRNLPGRASTVFNAPSREATYCDNYIEAKAANLNVTGKSLSCQSFAICKKIKEVDNFQIVSPQLELIESHPEIAFKALNDNKVLKSRKKNKDGIAERLQILSHFNANARRVYQEVLNNTLRKNVARDDIVDAMCLAVTLEKSKPALKFLQDDNKFDERGIPIRIGLINP